MKRKTILDYFYPKKVGEVLDQTQPPESRKSYRDQVVFTNIWLELIKQNKCTQKYGITLTFSTKWHIEDALTLHRIVQTKMARSTVCKNIKYILFPEYTAKGILHYHGIIFSCYQTPFIRFSKWWKRSFGHTKEELEIRYYLCSINPAKCMQSSLSKAKYCWSHYITKDYHKNGLWTLTNYTNHL